MSKIKVGINGFGRIGRITFRAILKRDNVEVVAINDLLDVNHLAYLLKYDSVHGKLEDSISVEQNSLVVNGNRIRVTAERDPIDINWGEMNIDVVKPWLETLARQWRRCSAKSLLCFSNAPNSILMVTFPASRLDNTNTA